LGLRARTTALPEKVRPERSPTSPRGTSSHTSHAAKKSTRSRRSRLQPLFGQQNVVLAAAAVLSASRFALRSSASGTATRRGTSLAFVGNGVCRYSSRFERPGTSELKVRSITSTPSLLALLNR
tara:strand:- start:227 stop:598 length:372 start_codon:yes stop_codon:yes gene_type:complete